MTPRSSLCSSCGRRAGSGQSSTGVITPDNAVEKMGVLERLASDVLAVEPVDDRLRPGMEIALRSRLTFYDAAYIAQARRLDARLATLDQRQARAARENGVEALEP